MAEKEQLDRAVRDFIWNIVEIQCKRGSEAVEIVCAQAGEYR